MRQANHDGKESVSSCSRDDARMKDGRLAYSALAIQQGVVVVKHTLRQVAYVIIPTVQYFAFSIGFQAKPRIFSLSLNHLFNLGSFYE